LSTAPAQNPDPLPAPGHNIITVTARNPAGTTFTAGAIVDHFPFDTLPSHLHDPDNPLQHLRDLLDQPLDDEPDQPEYDGRTLAAIPSPTNPAP